MSSAVRVVGRSSLVRRWTERLGDSWERWSALATFLLDVQQWPRTHVESVASESLRILSLLPDPSAAEPFQARGLVVGYVQSGKTANYTAVAARAADAGYRLVIVLSGIHDSLRNQTQRRLERELVHCSELPTSVQSEQPWLTLTSATEDFKSPALELLDQKAIFLAIVKKNTLVLQKLDAWLASAGSRLNSLPVLVIDDEADQASINTKGNRAADPALEDESIDEDPGPKPSPTNALIRSILARAPRASYVAYTATPFANLLINPEAVDRRVGVDLFPKDFVLQLPRPQGYTGTEELFGVSAQGRKVLNIVPPDDVAKLKAKRKRLSKEVVIGLDSMPGIPESLADAVLTFCLAGAVRNARGMEGQANTMLVHVSQLTTDQERVARLLEEQIDLWCDATRQGQDIESLLFAPIWNEMKNGMTSVPEDAFVLREAVRVLHSLVVIRLNSIAGEDLEYDTKAGRHIVAVGGNRLSRGLTLEGLTVSYFLRTASMCDTLLQMARWYGFRLGYEDLIRIWTTDGIASWFAELALVEQSLRDSIVALARAGRRPDQMAIRLRAHSKLLLTARNKATTATASVDSWSGEHPQTILLPLSDPPRLQRNFVAAERLVIDVGDWRPVGGGLLARDVLPEIVIEFLRRYQGHDDAVAFRADLIADWIAERCAAGELTDWSVFIASPSAGRIQTVGGLEIGLVKRRRVGSESIGILVDPAHEGVDLPGGASGYLRQSGEYDAEAMRSARPATQGLLIVYPLDPKYMGLDSSISVIALALSLPQTSDVSTKWIVNSMVANG
ncbi:MAG: Z1 domain-containing protein [Pseudomonadales bacterium]